MAAAPPLPLVRLRPEEIAAVKRIVAEHFGPDAEVQVFGSRARLDQRGGDLDLHVRVLSPAPGWEVECRAVAAIESALDDRHTDLIVLAAGDAPRRIDEVARATGVLLWRSATTWRKPWRSRGGLRRGCGKY